MNGFDKPTRYGQVPQQPLALEDSGLIIDHLSNVIPFRRIDFLASRLINKNILHAGLGSLNARRRDRLLNHKRCDQWFRIRDDAQKAVIPCDCIRGLGQRRGQFRPIEFFRWKLPAMAMDSHSAPCALRHCAASIPAWLIVDAFHSLKSNEPASFWRPRPARVRAPSAWPGWRIRSGRRRARWW